MHKRVLVLSGMIFFIIPGMLSAFAGGLPSFDYSHVLISPVQMKYNPTGELIFPCLVRVDAHVTNPLGKYYLYYAPHDNPGGICLAYADAIEGPYTEYRANPVLAKNHQDKFNVSHVSAPFVTWMADYNKFFMYFHGENTTTRWAYSVDGINWDVANANISLTAKDFGPDFKECSYGKVYEYSIPGIDDPYFMVMMLLSEKTGSGLGGGRRIGLATSKDGKVFTPRDTALVFPAGDEGANLSGPAYYSIDGKHYIFYHASSGNIHYAEVGTRFDLENHQGVFYNPSPDAPELDKAADCFMVYDNSAWHMIYTVGTRLKQSIAYARQNNPTGFKADFRTTPFTDNNRVVTALALSRGVLILGLQNPDPVSHCHVSLYSVDGRMVFQSSLAVARQHSFTSSMHCPDLPRGSYVCSVTMNGRVTISRRVMSFN